MTRPLLFSTLLSAALAASLPAQSTPSPTPGAPAPRLEGPASANNDEALAQLVRSALAANPGTADLGIEVSANHGVITLRGAVRIIPQRRLAFWIATQARGVTRVIDRIGVDSNPRADDEIQRELRAHYASDPLFNENDLSVHVQDGVVRLAGRVDDAREKSWAEDDAWVNGVRRVDASALRADPTRFGSDAGRRLTPVSDADIRAEILRQFAFDPRVSEVSPQVTVDDHVVTLSGEVRSADAHAAALSIARNVGGVSQVIDRLRVNAGAQH